MKTSFRILGRASGGLHVVSGIKIRIMELLCNIMWLVSCYSCWLNNFLRRCRARLSIFLKQSYDESFRMPASCTMVASARQYATYPVGRSGSARCSRYSASRRSKGTGCSFFFIIQSRRYRGCMPPEICVCRSSTGQWPCRVPPCRRPFLWIWLCRFLYFRWCR